MLSVCSFDVLGWYFYSVVGLQASARRLNRYTAIPLRRDRDRRKQIARQQRAHAVTTINFQGWVHEGGSIWDIGGSSHCRKRKLQCGIVVHGPGTKHL